MRIKSTNLEKAKILSQAKIDNAGIAILEETNMRMAATIRLFLEDEIKYRANNAPKDERDKWCIFASQMSRGKIPTEAYIELRMPAGTYDRIFKLADRELKYGIS